MDIYAAALIWAELVIADDEECYNGSALWPRATEVTQVQRPQLPGQLQVLLDEHPEIVDAARLHLSFATWRADADLDAQLPGPGVNQSFLMAFHALRDLDPQVFQFVWQRMLCADPAQRCDAKAVRLFADKLLRGKVESAKAALNAVLNRLVASANHRRIRVALGEAKDALKRVEGERGAVMKLEQLLSATTPPARVRIGSTLLKHILFTRSEAEGAGVECGFNVAHKTYVVKMERGEKIHVGMYKNVDTAYASLAAKQGSGWCGNLHVHPYRLRMSKEASVGPSKEDYDVWIRFLEDDTCPTHTVRFVVGNELLFLVHLDKGKNPSIPPTAADGLAGLDRRAHRLMGIVDPAVLLTTAVAMSPHNRGYASSEAEVFSIAMTKLDYCTSSFLGRTFGKPRSAGLSKQQRTREREMLRKIKVCGNFWAGIANSATIYSQATHYYNICYAHLAKVDYFMGELAPRSKNCSLLHFKTDDATLTKIETWIEGVFRPFVTTHELFVRALEEES